MMRQLYRRSATFLLGVTVLLANGCIPSLYPIYTDQDVVARDQILGRWSSTAEPQTWEFTRASGTAYRLKYTDKEARSAVFRVRLTEIGEVLFMDLFPLPENESMPGFQQLHLVRAHTFYRVDLQQDRLSLSFLNPQWLKQQPGDRLAHTRKDNSVLLTADTETLRQFVAEHLDTEGAFTKPFVLRRLPQ